MIETLSLMVQAGILGAAIVALNSISVSKIINKENSDRESIKYSSELIKNFLSDVIESCDYSDKHAETIGLSILNLDSLGVRVNDFTWSEAESIDVKKPFIKKQFEERKRLDADHVYLELTLKTQNKLEAFSTPFVAGVADEGIAFRSVGQAFCSVVERLYLEYAIAREKDKKDFEYFQNTVILYRRWKDKIEKFELTEQKNAIEQKLKEVEQKL